MEESGFCSLDFAAYYLQKLHNRAHADRKMRVLFLVHEPSLWDKQEYVYDLFAADDMVETTLVLLSSYNAIDAAEHKPAGRYVDKTWHFFHDRYPNVFDFTNVIDLNVFQPDYIFLPTPYDGLRPLHGTHIRACQDCKDLLYRVWDTWVKVFYSSGGFTRAILCPCVISFLRFRGGADRHGSCLPGYGRSRRAAF